MVKQEDTQIEGINLLATSGQEKTKTKFIHHVHKSGKKQKGQARNQEGKFVSTSGSGGLQRARHFSWKRALPLITIIALIGGFFVWQSFASSGYSKEWRVGSSEVTYKGMQSVEKTNGTKYWLIKQPYIPPPDPDRVGHTMVYYSSMAQMELTSAQSAKGIYCIDIQTGTRPVGIGFTGAGLGGSAADHKNKHIDKNKRTSVCTEADLGKGALVVYIDRYNTGGGPAAEAPATHIVIHKLYKKIY